MIKRSENYIVFYDGGCGFCHWAVRYVIRHDKLGTFRFAPLDGETIRNRLSQEVRQQLPDAIILKLNNSDEYAYKSGAEASLGIMKGLGGWNARAGRILSVFPKNWLEAGYRLLARIRRRIAKEPENVCPGVPDDLKNRFLP